MNETRAWGSCSPHAATVSVTLRMSIQHRTIQSREATLPTTDGAALHEDRWAPCRRLLRHPVTGNLTCHSSAVWVGRGNRVRVPSRGALPRTGIWCSCTTSFDPWVQGQVRSGQVRFITRPKSRTMRATRQLRPPAGYSPYLNLATLEYSTRKCYSRANHKYRRGPRGCAASS